VSERLGPPAGEGNPATPLLVFSHEGRTQQGWAGGLSCQCVGIMRGAGEPAAEKRRTGGNGCWGSVAEKVASSSRRRCVLATKKLTFGLEASWCGVERGERLMEAIEAMEAHVKARGGGSWGVSGDWVVVMPRGSGV